MRKEGCVTDTCSENVSNAATGKVKSKEVGIKDIVALTAGRSSISSNKGPIPSMMYILFSIQKKNVRCQNKRSSLSGLGFFLTAFTPHRFHAATLQFDHGRRVSTTKGTRWCPLLVECGHRWPESCQGALEYHTSQGCFWLRCHPSHHDQDMFPSLP